MLCDEADAGLGRVLLAPFVPRDAIRTLRSLAQNAIAAHERGKLGTSSSAPALDDLARTAAAWDSTYSSRFIRAAARRLREAIETREFESPGSPREQATVPGPDDGVANDRRVGPTDGIDLDDGRTTHEDSERAGLTSQDIKIEVPSQVRVDPIEAVVRGSAGLDDAALVASLADAAGTATENSELRDDPSMLFKKELAHLQRQVVGAALLRLLAVDPDRFSGQRLGGRAMALFDEIYSPTLYKAINLDAREQNYAKVTKLQPIARLAEASLTSSLLKFGDVASLPGARSELMKALNSPFCKAVVGPFLPTDLVPRLDELFRAVDMALNERGQHAQALVERANGLLIHFAGQCRDDYSKYVSESMADVATRLAELLVSHFKSSPASQPARLRVELTEKKYPLHERGRPLEVDLRLINDGPGIATRTRLAIDSGVGLNPEDGVTLGTVAPGSLVVPVKGTVGSVDLPVELAGTVYWDNFDRSEGVQEFRVLLRPQRSDVDWDALARENPYELEPVESEAELVGRDDVLNELTALLESDRIGSAYVYGQKRVGKTSIVKVLESRLDANQVAKYATVYLLVGEYRSPDPDATVSELGRKLSKRVRGKDDRLKDLELPTFDRALAPITDFLDDVHERARDLRVIVILDEFDDLPLEVYRPGSVGDSLFQSIRSISSKQWVGVILVGGEKMEYVIDAQGQALNKFGRFRIDYLDRETHWGDFTALVRQPVADWLELSDEAVLEVYEQTAGNPYYTKLLCGEIVKQMRAKRDSHVTARNVEAAVAAVVHAEGGPSFQHFWDDGIVDVPPRYDDIRLRRKKTLLAFAEASRSSDSPTTTEIVAAAGRYGLDPQICKDTLVEYARRGVLVVEGDLHRCKVPLFGSWLKDRGISEIMTTFIDQDAVILERRRHEEAYVKDEELRALVDRWVRYKDRTITVERIRHWLNQFGDNYAQRRLLPVLTDLRFYTRDLVREKVASAHKLVQRSLTDRGLESVVVGQRKRGHVMVSYLGGPAKSGTMCASLYVEENRIYSDHLVERGKVISEVLRQRDQVQALIFVDDFVGSGTQSSKFLASFVDEWFGQGGDDGLVVFFVALAGFQAGFSKLERAVTELNLPVEVRVCDMLTDADKCFSDSSEIYPDPVERAAARDLIERLGDRLGEKRNPVGYSDGQAIVVFENGCPNNSLPILWKQTDEWEALFPRY
jgi:hypothetical protein